MTYDDAQKVLDTITSPTPMDILFKKTQADGEHPIIVQMRQSRTDAVRLKDTLWNYTGDDDLNDLMNLVIEKINSYDPTRFTP